ncbi:bestrophin family protein [Mesorhizobium sp. ZC-5]|uniref:bestrophin family protein n=1 Tax=Mesorhizobium sp. ZC-5 TaxID=2986066 RepID=UPI0021E729B5|nr:bestrophin family ion channel [Mesorhizobium sp. ZC-5]MCV3239135.1 hypothetical protein [Mesorhizobium sp. ZC-5]
MIVRPRPSFWKLFFVMRGSVVPRILPQIFGFALYGAVVVALVKALELDLGNAGVAPFALLGVALSVYLGFRNNAAYDRWWEARKLWGQLVFEIRNLSRAASALIADRDELRPLLMDSLAFCHFLRGELRKVDAREQARGFVGDAAEAIFAASNQPDAAMRRMGQRIGALKRRGTLEPMDFRILDERLSALSAMQAGCERIMGTPLPFAYTLLLQRTAYIFCLLLPFGLAFSAGWATPLFTALIAYTFFGLDALSEELEDPFGTQANDLALDGLCRVCEISVFEALGETPPPPIAAERFYYS